MATQYFTASSIDGFVAEPDATLAWLTSRDIDHSGPMAYDAFITDVGAMAMGATTYEWILAHDVDDAGQPRWGYDLPCWVFTHRELPRADGDIRFVQGDVAQVQPELLAAAGDRNVWVVGGGPLAAQYAEAGLLDEVWVQYAPVALGAGAPLLPEHVELALLDVARNRDFVCARYAVVRPEPQG